MLFEGRYKTQDYFRYFLPLFSVPSFIFSISGRELILVLTSKDSLKYSLSLFNGWFHLQLFYSVQNVSCSFTYKLYRPTNYLKLVMLTSPGFILIGANLLLLRFHHRSFYVYVLNIVCPPKLQVNFRINIFNSNEHHTVIFNQ